MALLLPQPALAAGGLHHPLGDATRDRRRIHEPHELRRRYQADAGLAPADERLGAGEHPVLEIELRLEEQLELVALDRLPQLRLQQEARLELVADRTLEKHVVPAACRLGAVESEICIAEQLIRGA